jgi:hypothetical protein
MNVKTITVEIHEKRNHPHEYGHYDARVSYTVELEEGDSPEMATLAYLSTARQQVVTECDRWIAEIEHKRQVEEAKRELHWILERAKSSGVQDNDAENFEENLLALPTEQQDEYRAKLEAAKQEYLSGMRERLENDIKAAEKGLLSQYSQANFYVVLNNLPEAERDAYRIRMENAPSKEDK